MQDYTTRDVPLGVKQKVHLLALENTGVKYEV